MADLQPTLQSHCNGHSSDQDWDGLEGSAEGVFAEDLYTIKATGKPFTYQLCIRLDFDPENGLIDRVNEYYT